VPVDVGICEQRIRTGEDGVRVVLPVLHRPHRAVHVFNSLVASQRELPLRALFVVSFGDRAQMEAVRATGADFVQLYEGRRSGDYARKINTGAALTKEPWIFTAADDVHFYPGWADAAVDFATANLRRAVGVNDRGRWSNRHKEPPATHFLVHRSYVAEGTADERDVIFHTGYDHTYVDTEFIETASRRGEYGYCAESVVEHLHPVWRKGQRDEVYQLGARQTKQDFRLYLTRRQLWKS
jgi:hypothetical protein